MGEWSDYFEDFPEENLANWVDGRFDPAGAARRRAHEAQSRQVAEDSKALQRKMFQMAADAKRAAAERARRAALGNENSASEATSGEGPSALPQ